jgi:1-acyl-sn-glycerol-3-phosphate acyltransferase
MAVAHAVAPGGWAPSSPCTPDCLPPADGPGARRLRVVVGLIGLVAVLLGAVVGAPVLPSRMRDRWLRACSRSALRTVGVRLRVRGDARFTEGTARGALVVANHLSWMDVLALDAVQPVRMLAKREVRDWPVIGGLAARTGALFVDRAGLRALPSTVAATADALRAGAAVGVFPEGTTWCGEAAGTFRRAAFQAAIDAGATVRPVAIAFRLVDGTPARAAAFVGEQTLVGSLLRVLRLRGLVCELTVLPAVPAGAGLDRRALARHAAEAVGAVTGVRHGAPPAVARPGPVTGIAPAAVPPAARPLAVSEPAAA